MFHSELKELVVGRMWTLDRPVWFSGIRQRARTTVVRVDDGSLLIHSPAPPSAPKGTQSFSDASCIN